MLSFIRKQPDRDLQIGEKNNLWLASSPCAALACVSKPTHSLQNDTPWWLWHNSKSPMTNQLRFSTATYPPALRFQDWPTLFPVCCKMCRECEENWQTKETTCGYLSKPKPWQRQWLWSQVPMTIKTSKPLRVEWLLGSFPSASPHLSLWQKRAGQQTIKLKVKSRVVWGSLHLTFLIFPDSPSICTHVWEADFLDQPALQTVRLNS